MEASIYWLDSGHKYDGMDMRYTTWRKEENFRAQKMLRLKTQLAK